MGREEGGGFRMGNTHTKKKKISLDTHEKMKKENTVCETAKETQMYRTVFWTLWERKGGNDLGESCFNV